jgi:3-oxoadipate enol-lactonase
VDLDLPHSDHGPRTGTPILLLHGFPLDHAMWRDVEGALSGAGLRVLAPDLRGMGRGPLGKGPGSMAAYAGDVLRLADRAGLRRFALAGFSMGGYVAFEVARRAPERLLGLALVDTRMEADSEGGRAAMMEKVRQQGAQALVDAMLPKMLTKDAPAEAVERVRAAMLRTPVEGAVHALEAMAARPDSAGTLRGLRCPVLVVVGDQDAITPPDAARAMAQANPGARLVVVPGAHLTPVESPGAVSAAMVEWAKGLG